MQAGGPSHTAIACAGSRAAHLVVDEPPFLFEDTVAAVLLGDIADMLVEWHRNEPMLADTRVRAVARSRYTEDRLAEAVGRGVDQYVILGAGLDTFAYRSKLAASVRVFEVDHPSTQQWKRDRLAATGITVPAAVTYVSVDFTTDSLAECLEAAGFDARRASFVSWLGVTFYLTAEAIGTTLAVIGRWAQGTELVCEYNLPSEMRDAAAQRYADFVMPTAARHGEPWLTSLRPDEMTTLLTDHGLHVVEQLDQQSWVSPDLWQRADTLRPTHFAMLARARRSTIVNPA